MNFICELVVESFEIWMLQIYSIILILIFIECSKEEIYYTIYDSLIEWLKTIICIILFIASCFACVGLLYGISQTYDLNWIEIKYNTTRS
jgi:hypothetical protein